MAGRRPLRSISAIPPATASNSPSPGSGAPVMRRLKRGTRLVVASHNPGKLWEINELIRPYGLEAVCRGARAAGARGERDDVRGQRAAQGARRGHGSGLPALADDSGLAVDALDGAPGVTSARWAGPTRDFAIAMQRLADALARVDLGPRARRAPISSPRCALPGRTARPTCSRAVSMAASWAAARRQRLRLRSDVPARRPRPDVRRDGARGEIRHVASHARSRRSAPPVRGARGARHGRPGSPRARGGGARRCRREPVDPRRARDLRGPAPLGDRGP